MSRVAAAAAADARRQRVAALQRAWADGDYRELRRLSAEAAVAGPQGREVQAEIARAARLRLDPTTLALGAGATAFYVVAWAWALAGRH